MTITVEISARTDVGNEREHNEDNFLVGDLTKKTRRIADGEAPLGPSGLVVAVCDGMGGAAAGEVASELAVTTIFEHLTRAGEGQDDVATTRDGLAERLESAAQVSSKRIHDDASANEARQGMGTTLTAAALLDDHLIFAQVGDSRGYILRQGKLTQITRDQSLVAKLVERGSLTEEQALTFEHSNIILQALGASPTVVVELTQVELRRGDRLLLCSDGLSGLIPHDEIRELLADKAEPGLISMNLVERAKEHGGHDNVTAIVVLFGGPSLRDDAAAVEVHRYGGGRDLLPIPDPRQLGDLLNPTSDPAPAAMLEAVVSDPPPSRGPSPVPSRPPSRAPSKAPSRAPSPVPSPMPPRATPIPTSEPRFPEIPRNAPVPTFDAPSAEIEPNVARAMPSNAPSGGGASSFAPAPSKPRNTLVIAAALLAVAIVGGSIVYVLADSRPSGGTASPGAPASGNGDPESQWTSIDNPAASYPAGSPPPGPAPATPTVARTETRPRNEGARAPAPPAAPKPQPTVTAPTKKSDLAPQRDEEP